MSEQAVQQQPQMGRPSKYNPKTVGNVLGSLQAGLSVESACEYAGINPDTHYEWVKQYPEYSEKVTAARLYGKILASKQVTDVLQDITRDKPKYSEVTRTNTAKWYLEKHEKQIYGNQGVLAAKTETNEKGGTTTTLIYATDDILRQYHSQEEVTSGQLLEALEDSLQGEEVTGGGDQEPAPPVHPEELQGEHPQEESVSQP